MCKELEPLLKRRVPKTPLFGTHYSLLQSVCAFSHLYPEPLHIVVGLIAGMSPEVRFTPRALGFCSRS
jgi:hypothetical protein